MKIFNIIQRIDIRQKQIKNLCRFLVFFCAISYLSNQAMTGKNGYKSHIKIKKELEERQKALDGLKDNLENIKLKVEHLSDTSLDLDLLEERCRVILNYSYPDEVIIRTSTIHNPNFG